MKRRKKVNGEKIFSVVITCAIVLTLAIGVISVIKNSQHNSNPNNIVDLNETKDNNLALNNNDSIVQEKKTEIATENVTLKNEEDTVKETKVAGDVAAESPTGASAKYSFSENDTLKWPVKGDIIIKYDMEHGVFFKTLSQYKTNPAIVISAEAGKDVVASASGIVESVSNENETGLTLVVNIGNGYTTTYGQLENVTLKKGSTIVAGSKIGTVAKPSKYYTAEGSNIYFKLLKGDAHVDPTTFLVEE